MKRLRLALVNHHPRVQQGVRQAIDRCQDIELVGEASDTQVAIQMASTLSPDVMLVEIGLPGVSGIEVARLIRRRTPHITVVMFAGSEDDEQLFNVVKAGAAAFIAKDIDQDDLIRTVRRAGRGEYIINESVVSRPSVAARVLKQFQDQAGLEQYEGSVFSPLTRRELEILDSIARGMSNKEISSSLSISTQTVKNYVTSILRKLTVNDRTQAVIHALQRGWIKMPPEVE